jgi:hypothetical protein
MRRSSLCSISFRSSSFAAWSSAPPSRFPDAHPALGIVHAARDVVHELLEGVASRHSEPALSGAVAVDVDDALLEELVFVGLRPFRRPE